MNKLQNLISELEKHHKKKLDLSLGRTFNLLKKLGNPQDKLNNIVTIVGTNAKASMSYSLKDVFYLDAQVNTGTAASDAADALDLSAYVDPIAKGRSRGVGLAIYKAMFFYKFSSLKILA